MKKLLLKLLAGALLIGSARAAIVTGNIIDACGNPAVKFVRFQPPKQYLKYGTNTVLSYPVRANADTNNNFSTFLVGGYYDAYFGNDDALQPLRIFVRLNDTNTYTLNDVAQLAVNIAMRDPGDIVITNLNPNFSTATNLMGQQADTLSLAVTNTQSGVALTGSFAGSISGSSLSNLGPLHVEYPDSAGPYIDVGESGIVMSQTNRPETFEQMRGYFWLVQVVPQKAPDGSPVGTSQMQLDEYGNFIAISTNGNSLRLSQDGNNYFDAPHGSNYFLNPIIGDLGQATNYHAIKSLSSTNGLFTYSVNADGTTNANLVVTNVGSARLPAAQITGNINASQLTGTVPMATLPTVATNNPLAETFIATNRITDTLAQSQVRGLVAEWTGFPTNYMNALLLNPEFKPTNCLSLNGTPFSFSNAVYTEWGADFVRGSQQLLLPLPMMTNWTLTFRVRQNINREVDINAVSQFSSPVVSMFETNTVSEFNFDLVPFRGAQISECTNITFWNTTVMGNGTTNSFFYPDSRGYVDSFHYNYHPLTYTISRNNGAYRIFVNTVPCANRAQPTTLTIYAENLLRGVNQLMFGRDTNYLQKTAANTAASRDALETVEFVHITDAIPADDYLTNYNNLVNVAWRMSCWADPAQYLDVWFGDSQWFPATDANHQLAGGSPRCYVNNPVSLYYYSNNAANFWNCTSAAAGLQDMTNMVLVPGGAKSTFPATAWTMRPAAWLKKCNIYAQIGHNSVAYVAGQSPLLNPDSATYLWNSIFAPWVRAGAEVTFISGYSTVPEDVAYTTNALVWYTQMKTNPFVAHYCDDAAFVATNCLATNGLPFMTNSWDGFHFNMSNNVVANSLRAANLKGTATRFIVPGTVSGSSVSIYTNRTSHKYQIAISAGTWALFDPYGNTLIPSSSSTGSFPFETGQYISGSGITFSGYQVR